MGSRRRRPVRASAPSADRLRTRGTGRGNRLAPLLEWLAGAGPARSKRQVPSTRIGRRPSFVAAPSANASESRWSGLTGRRFPEPTLVRAPRRSVWEAAVFACCCAAESRATTRHQLRAGGRVPRYESGRLRRCSWFERPSSTSCTASTPAAMRFYGGRQVGARPARLRSRPASCTSRASSARCSARSARSTGVR